MIYISSILTFLIDLLSRATRKSIGETRTVKRGVVLGRNLRESLFHPTAGTASRPI